MNSATGAYYCDSVERGFEVKFAVPNDMTSLRIGQEACVAGKYSVGGEKGDICTACDEGKYSEARNSSYCQTVEAGFEVKFTVPNDDTSLRIGQEPCESNHYSEGGVDTCTKCEKGSHAEPGSAGCKYCAPGEFFDSVATECKNCTIGRYSTKGGEQRRRKHHFATCL